MIERIEQGYILNEDVRVLCSNNEIRLRKGIWNYDEAVINLGSYSENFKKSFKSIISLMVNGQVVNDEVLKKYCNSDEHSSEVLFIFNELRKESFVSTKAETESLHNIANVLLGNLYVDSSNNEENVNVTEEKRILFISDNDYCKESALNLAVSLHINLDIVSDSIMNEFQNSDLTTKADSLSFVEKIDKLKKSISSYSMIIGCFLTPSLIVLRNLNRVLIEVEKPFSFSFIDGPFITMATIWPPHTGCFECFETRSLSRLEDHVTYQKFVKEGKLLKKSKMEGFVPLLNILVNFTISEGFLINLIGTSKFMGRVLNIYVPTLEIQAQDILRVPFCPACGMVSRVTNKEINISSSTIINKVISSSTMFKKGENNDD